MARVWHYDLYGKRGDKYAYLEASSLGAIPFVELTPQAPQYFFVPKDFTLQTEYEQGFKLDELFEMYASGIKTGNDSVAIVDNPEDGRILLSDAHTLNVEEFSLKYDIKGSCTEIIKDLTSPNVSENNVIPYYYRVLDKRYIVYTGVQGLVARHRFAIMQHLLNTQNIALNVARQCSSDEWSYIYCSDGITDTNYIANSGKNGLGHVFPLYLYSEEIGEDGVVQRVRQTNLKAELLERIETKLGEAVQLEELFDYIYSVLHRRDYRQRYREFLKIDFPRIPYPSSSEQYHREAERGHRLRLLHLMQGLPSDLRLPHKYPIAGENRVDKPRYVASTETEAGRIYLNGEQYFEGVMPEVWGFYIGGYQPAQKWLKDHGKKGYLTSREVQHYRRILYVLSETQQILAEISKE